MNSAKSHREPHGDGVAFAWVVEASLLMLTDEKSKPDEVQ